MNTNLTKINPLQAEHKCSKCHVIFDDRKMMLLHKRRFHPAALNKIKSEPEATAASAAAAIAARIQVRNYRTSFSYCPNPFSML